MSEHEYTVVPPKAKLIGGVWLPEEELHLVKWMETSKRAERRDGKLTYQIHKLDMAMSFVPESGRKVALDIGAHVGLWSMWLTKLFARVIAFEPVPDHYNIYPYNVTDRNAHLHHVALGADYGEVTMGNTPGESTGNTHVVTSDPANLVSMFPLDHFKLQNVDFIKIDTEGYEKQILLGARKTIEDNKPVIIVEQKGYEATYFDGERQEAVALLESWGMHKAAEVSGDFIMVWP